MPEWLKITLIVGGSLVAGGTLVFLFIREEFCNFVDFIFHPRVPEDKEKKDD